ncbi:hypothetical protein FE783_15655 [Paenibacillus mesophilus]|uniref:chitobiase/beta-hexosaminidase C-terminal domain-containing protein n=1 Tax=Paenibacillus mesophilus TaxID=2582849 RepID=UPI00110D462F|nr:chitobiase/beta-hexosaminidase C-terminal domain-containing protein [Paenibacillus mesophilus]TMV49101.1 hypothetical protein FE783_15655 [Paenibacillus mesophilus]
MIRKHKAKAVFGIAFAAILFAVLGLAGLFNVNADTDKWTDHANTAWYNPDYVTFTIDTPAKLAGAAKLVSSGTVDGLRNKILEVDRDLDLSAYEWVPIGTEQHPFRGTLIAKNNATFKINGMKLSGNLTYAGLVGFMDRGTVGGFEFTSSGKIDIGSVNTSGILYVWQSVYSQTYGTIWDYVPVQDTTVAYAGAAAGKMVNSSIVYNITNHIPVKADFAIKHVYAGGIVGAGEGSISNSSNLAPVTAKGPNIESGGIVGYGESQGLIMKKVANQAAVQANGGGTIHAAGIIGYAAGRLGMADEDTPITNTGAVQITGARIAYAAGIVGRAGAAVDFSDTTSNGGVVTIQSPTAEGSYSAALIGSIDAEQANPQFRIAFANSAPITNHGGSNVHAGALAGSVNSTFVWGKPFTNTVPITVSGLNQAFTGGLIGKAAGTVTFADTAKNSAAITVGSIAMKPNEAYTGGLVGYAGKRVLLDSTAGQAYVNSGEINVSGGTGVYTGGIVANKAYARTSGVVGNNVSSTADIRVSGLSKLYTGGYIGIVPGDGADKAISGAAFNKEITVAAASSASDRTVSTGGIVGYYVNHSDSGAAIDLAVFQGKIQSTGGGNESYTGGIAGYVDGGAIKNAHAGNTAAEFAKLATDGNAGGIAGFLNGSVDTATVNYATIVLQTAGGISGGVVGKAQGAIAAATAGDAEFATGYSVRLESAVRDAVGSEDRITSGGIVGTNTNAFSLTNSRAANIGLITQAGRSHYTLGSLAGSLTADAQVGQPGAPVTADHMNVELLAANSQVGGAIGHNRSAKAYVKAEQMTFSIQGAQAKAGGISGIHDAAAGTIPGSDGQGAAGFALNAGNMTFTTTGSGASVGGIVGENLGDTPRASAESITITSGGADSRLGGLAGTNRGTLMESSASRIAITSSGAAAEAGGIAGRSEVAVGGPVAAKIIGPHVHVEDAVLIASTGERSWIGGIVGSAKLTEIVNPRVEAVAPNYVSMTVNAAHNGAGGLAGRIEQGKLLGDSTLTNIENLLITTSAGSTSAYAGGAAAYQDQTSMNKITGRTVNLIVNGGQSVVGGMAGYNRGSASAYISNTFMDGLNIKASETAVQSKAGGFVGVNDKQDGDPAASPASGVSSIQNSRYVGSVQMNAPSSITGGLVGENRSLIANNSITDKIPVSSKGQGGIVGGLVGVNSETGTLYYTYSNSTLAIEGEGTLAGGFVGDNKGKVIASYVDIDVLGNAHGTPGSPVFLGGLAGRNTGVIDKSHSVSKVTASGGYTNVGGLVGDQAGGTISNSYAGNVVTAAAEGSYAGGLLGRITGGEVTTVYSAAQVQAWNGAYAGGFAGRYDNASKELLYKAYYVKDEALETNKDLPDFADGNHRWLQVHARLSTLLSSTLMDRTTFPALSGWDFEGTWKYGSVNADYKYPELQRSANTGGEGGGGSGGEVNANIAWYMRDKFAFAYDIKTEAELAGLAALVNGTVTGAERFDFEGRTIRIANPIHIQSRQWIPIGKAENTPFQGTFDGGSHLIDGLMLKPDYGYSGLFGVIGEKAKASNIVMEPLSVAGTGYTGILAGYNKGQVQNVTIKAAKDTTISGGTVGSLIGKNTGTFRNASVTLESGSTLEAVGTGAVAGGLIGDNAQSLDPSLFAFRSTGIALKSSAEHATIGGLIGKQTGPVRSFKTDMDYSIAAYGPNSMAGGLIGRHVSGLTEDVTLTYTSGTIAAQGTGSIVGGLTGHSDAGNTLNGVSVTASQTGRQLSGNGTLGGLIGSKTGAGTNSFDIERVKVDKLSIASLEASPEATLGGIAGKLSRTAVHQATSDAVIQAAGGQVTAGGIVGSGQDSILDRVDAVSNMTFSAKSGESSMGGIAGILSAGAMDQAFDFGRRAPLYPGIYEAHVRGNPLVAQGGDSSTDLNVGGIVGKLIQSSVYYAKTNVDLAVHGGKEAAVGGIAGASSGIIVSSEPLQSIKADTSVVYDIGGVVGRSTGGQIHYTSAASPDGQNITVERAVTKQGTVPAAHVGGLIGRGDNTKVTNAYAALPVKVTDDNPDTTIYIGGFAGILGDSDIGSSSMERVYALGSVEAKGITGSYAGGFAGSIDRYEIADAYATGKVDNTGYDTGSGGFAGAVERRAVIRHAYATQDSLTTTGVNHPTRSYTGGFAGYNDGTLNGVFAKTAAMTVNVSGANVFKGALVGYNFRDGKVLSSAYTAEPSPIGYNLGISTGNDQADVSESYSEFRSWNFDLDAPFLNRTIAADWIIVSGNQLSGIVRLYNADTGLGFYNLFHRTAVEKPAVEKILLGADIDLAGRKWTPFGDFRGQFDGQGYKLKGFKHTAGSADIQGFIAENSGLVTRVAFEDAFVSAGSRVGIVAGINHAGGVIRDTRIGGRVEGRDYIGGAVGINHGQITGSTVNAAVTAAGNDAGGIAGSNAGELNQVEVQGSVKGVQNVGGAAGENNNKLTAVTAIGLRVDGVSAVGGLAGFNSGTIERSSANSAVAATGGYAGGIAGIHEGRVQQSYTAGTVTVDTAEPSAAAGGIAGDVKQSGIVEQSFSYADIVAKGDSATAGGIAGVSSGTIIGAYASGKVYAQGQTAAKAGGITGYAAGGTISGSLSYGEIIAGINELIQRNKTFYGGIAGQKAANAIIGDSFFNKQALKNDTAYFDADGKRASGAVTGAAGLTARQLTQGRLPKGLDGAIWEAAEGYYPALKPFGGSNASKLSTAAVILNEGDLMSRIGGSFTLTSDPSLHWQADENAQLVRDSAGILSGSLKSTARAVLTVQAGDESRRVAINTPSFKYEVTVPTPKAAPSGSTFTDRVVVTLTADEPSASIYYTLNGSQPSAGSQLYTGPITLTSTTTIKAVAIAEEMENSPVMTGTWTKQTFSMGGGGFFVAPQAIEAAIGGGKIAVGSSEPVKVARNSILKLKAPAGHVIYYTTDGSTPTKNSKVYKEGSIVITGEMTVKAITDKDDRVITIKYEVENAKYELKKDAGEVKYITGYGNKEFRPDAAITRYELLDALSPLLDKEDVSVDNLLADVKDEVKDQVAFFTSAGIIEGYPDGTFGGERGLTRAEFVVMMSRVLRLDVSAPGTTVLTDVAGHWSEWYVNAFTKAGYVDGFPDGTFQPDSEISRAQAVVVINRIIGMKKQDVPAAFSDLTPDHWAFQHIMSAAK